ncbi:MAG: PDDEXK nuclease domain-containing protein [Pirellulales bacterium]
MRTSAGNTTSRVDEEDYFIDLLFYHLRLHHCHVVVELKVEKFKPGARRQVDLYVSAVDSQVMNAC